MTNKSYLRYAATAGVAIVAGFAIISTPANAASSRLWNVPDPLYEPLLSDTPPGLAREGVLMWAHNVSNVNMLRQAARRFGLRYSLDERYQEAGQYQMRFFGTPPTTPNDGEKYGVKYVYFIPRGGSASMIAKGTPWLIDPEIVDKTLEEFDRQLSVNTKDLWAIAAGDEAIHKARLGGSRLMADPPADYPYLQQADEEVRTQFGGGKWGIPHGEKDPNPYRWIAFNKWLNVKFHERAVRIREIMKKHQLDIPFVSYDPQANTAGNDYSGIANDYDIFTHQTSVGANVWGANTGFFTKILVDLTGKEVWPCVHTERYGLDTTPQETQEALSQAFRNGGSGFHFYLPDTAGMTKQDGDMRLAYFGSPRRYNTILNVIDLIRTMPKLRFPDTRTAVLYNDDMMQSALRGPALPRSSTEGTYMFLGPVARSWFQFIDNTKVLSSASLNEQFDTLYVPSATIQRPEVVEKLRAFVENGGTLICNDATAFSTDTLGNDTSDARRDIFGVETGDETTPKVLSVKLNQKKYSLKVLNPAVKLNPATGTKVLGTFEDGSAAITSHALGRGTAILFASDFFNRKAVSNSDWRNFATAWAAAFKSPTGLDIWRFQFPDSVLGKDIPVPSGQCLTNNHVTWQEEKPVTTGNIDLKGKYQLQPAPNAMKDAPADAQNWISFTEGHLTDRRQSMLDRKVKPASYVGYENPDSRWMTSWKSTSDVMLIFDLQKPVKPTAVKFWFNDTMPTFTVQGSNDLHRWQPIGKNGNAQNAGKDVLDISVSLNAAQSYQYVRVVFAPRANGQKLTLVESELWGTP